MTLDETISGRKTPLASLTRATGRIARAGDMDQLVEIIRQTARALVGCEGIAFIRREGSLCRYVEEDAIGPLWKGQAFPASICVSGWAMIGRRTIVIADISLDDRVPHELYDGSFVKALAIAPIRVDDPLGAIGAYWSQPYSPTRWEIETLEALAEAAAIAIETIDLKAQQAKPVMRAAASPSPPAGDFTRDIESVAGIAAVPAILDIVLGLTGMGFAAVARVTETRWVTCKSCDRVGFGLGPGDELPVETTLCDEIRDHRQPIVFDDAATDARYRDHHTPRIYNLRSYISVPIVLADGRFWGTLCAIGAEPAKVDNPQVIGTFQLFAELIAHHLHAGERLEVAQSLLDDERQLSELREQFIAILGHDLRNPLAAVDAGTSRLLKEGWTERSPQILQLMKASICRMSGLVDNVMDFTRARLGGGIVLDLAERDLADTLRHVIEEIRVVHPGRAIDMSVDFPGAVKADHLRLAQMVSNLLSNAISHGSADLPIAVTGLVAGDSLEIHVVNGGPPIAPGTIDKLFLPFRKGDSSANSAGLGLGLFIASEIAKAHGGRIEVRSDTDRTCFTIHLPMSG